MRKAILGAAVAAALFIATQSSQAYISITWFATAGFYDPIATTEGLLSDSNTGGQSTLVQLINAGADNTIDPVDPLGVNFLSDDDTLLQQITYTHIPPDNSFTEYAASLGYGVYTQANATFKFYVRIFQDNTPAALEKYYDSTLTDAAVQVTEPASQLYDANTDPNGDQLTLTIPAIPEPATAAFMGFGLLGLAARALRRRA